MKILFVFNSILFTAVLGGGLYFYYRFLLPLRRLNRDIKAVRYGRTDCILPDHRSDILGQLAHEYNLLFQSLQDTRDQIHSTKAKFEATVFHRTERFRKDIHRLQKMAHTDPLTGLANRAFLEQYLDFVFSQSRKCSTSLTCLLIDVDNFKAVNDTLGHETGDKVLHFIGELLNSCLREQDFAARFGGDEFVVLLPDCTDVKARRIAERIRLLFARESWRFLPRRKNPTDEMPAPRLSIGMSSMKNLPKNADDLIRLADQSLYRAKQSGKNRIAAC